jgi:hypothetical protein
MVYHIFWPLVLMCDITVFCVIYRVISHNFQNIMVYTMLFGAQTPCADVWHHGFWCYISSFAVICWVDLRIYLHLLVQITLSYHKGGLYQGQDVMYQTDVWYPMVYDIFLCEIFSVQFFSQRSSTEQVSRLALLHWTIVKTSCFTKQ